MKMMKLCCCSSSSSPSILLDDVWFKIFLWLPLESIFKYRCVSKLWLSILSNPLFITKWMSSNSSSWTLVYNYLCTLPMFSTASLGVHSKFISDVYDEFSSRFIEERKIYVLASSNGLVLCSKTYPCLKHYVCNPLTKKCISLPSPRNRENILNGFVCDSPSSSLMNPTRYYVVLIQEWLRTPSTIFNVEIFSSDLGEWNTYQVSCPEQVTWHHRFARVVTQINGVLYWFEGSGNRIIAYDLNDDKTQCKLINLPKDLEYCYDLFINQPPASSIQRRLVESEGLLCCCLIKRQSMTLSLGVLKEDSNGEQVWDLEHKNVELKDVSTSFRLLAMNPVDRNVVILSCDNNIFAYNIQTRTSEALHLSASFHGEHCFGNIGFLPFILRPMPTTIPPLVQSGTSKALPYLLLDIQ